MGSLKRNRGDTVTADPKQRYRELLTQIEVSADQSDRNPTWDELLEVARVCHWSPEEYFELDARLDLIIEKALGQVKVPN